MLLHKSINEKFRFAYQFLILYQISLLWKDLKNVCVNSW